MNLTIGRYHFPRGLPDGIPDHVYVIENERTTVRYTGTLGRLQERGLVPTQTFERWAEEVARAYPDWVEVLPKPPMTREQAVEQVRRVWQMIEDEWGAATPTDHWADFERAMLALGVRPDELADPSNETP